MISLSSNESSITFIDQEKVRFFEIDRFGVSFLPALEIIFTQVGDDGIKPWEKFLFLIVIEFFGRFENPDKGFLRYIHGLITVADHSQRQKICFSLIFLHKRSHGGLIAVDDLRD